MMREACPLMRRYSTPARKSGRAVDRSYNVPTHLYPEVSS